MPPRSHHPHSHPKLTPNWCVTPNPKGTPNRPQLGPTPNPKPPIYRGWGAGVGVELLFDPYRNDYQPSWNLLCTIEASPPNYPMSLLAPSWIEVEAKTLFFR